MGLREDALDEAAKLFDGWIEHDEAMGDNETADVLHGVVATLRALKRPDQTIKCVCDPSCPNREPAWSRSGLCQDCAACDCQHEMLGSDL